ncbi:MAG: aldo/keto reductase [Thermoleophilia bacterium]|jgi:methylglyoxal reductase
MRYRALGRSGIEASVVAFGAWAVGGWFWGGADDRVSVAAIHRALDVGVTLIDTAPVYGLGHSEEIVGKAIRGRRDQVVLATKCGLVWHTDKGSHFFDEMGTPIHRYLGPESIRYEVEQSLRRLQTDVIDLYQTHWQDKTTPIEDTMATLLELKQEGKIRAIGVSNATVAQMDEYRVGGSVDSDQEKYSMLERRIETEQLPYCLENNIAMLAYSPLGQGLLTGRVTVDRQLAEGDQRAQDPIFSPASRSKILAFLEDIRPIAEAYDATPAQMAIAWVLAQPGVTHALVGARTPQQVDENTAAGDIVLAGSDVSAITAALEGLEIGTGT